MYTFRVVQKVVLSRRARKDLRRVPRHVALKLLAWVEAVEEVEEVTKHEY